MWSRLKAYQRPVMVLVESLEDEVGAIAVTTSYVLDRVVTVEVERFPVM